MNCNILCVFECTFGLFVDLKYALVKKSYFSKLSHCLCPRKCLRISILNILSFLPPPSLSFCLYTFLYYSRSVRIACSISLWFSLFLFLFSYYSFAFFSFLFLSFFTFFAAQCNSHVDRIWHYNSKESSKQWLNRTIKKHYRTILLIHFGCEMNGTNNENLNNNVFEWVFIHDEMLKFV